MSIEESASRRSDTRNDLSVLVEVDEKWLKGNRCHPRVAVQRLRIRREQAVLAAGVRPAKVLKSN
jgi:hypothetical protein